MLIWGFCFFILSQFRLTDEIIENEKATFKEIEEDTAHLLTKARELLQKLHIEAKLAKKIEFKQQVSEILSEITEFQEKVLEETSQSNLYNVNLSIVQIKSQPNEPQNDNFNYTGFYVYGKNPQIKYAPYQRTNNKPAGLIVIPKLDEMCHPADLDFTFYHNQEAYPHFRVKYSPKLSHIPITGVGQFDELAVKVNAQNQQSNFTCLPEFIIYTKQQN